MVVAYVLNVSYVLEKYGYFNIFYNVNKFYVCDGNFYILLASRDLRLK